MKTPFKSSQIIALVIAVTCVIWISSGFLGANSKSPAEPKSLSSRSEKPLMQVRVRESRAQPFIADVIVTGRTQASRSVALKAETSGQILDLPIEEGDQIAEGDVLAALEIKDRKARLEEFEKRVRQRQIEYNAAKKLENEGFNSRIRLAQTLADLEKAKADRAQARIELDNTKITAPFDGFVFTQHVELGDFLDIGQTVFTIVDLDPIEIEGFVSERRIDELTLGTHVKAKFLNNVTLEGTLSFIAPAADEETRTFRIEVSAPNEDLAIRQGMTAKIYIPVDEKPAHKISPSILSLNDEGRVGVKLVNDQNIVEFAPVKILADQPDAMWIIGPPDSTKFITVGQDFVREGQKVEPVSYRGEGLL